MLGGHGEALARRVHIQRSTASSRRSLQWLGNASKLCLGDLPLELAMSATSRAKRGHVRGLIACFEQSGSE